MLRVPGRDRPRILRTFAGYAAGMDEQSGSGAPVYRHQPGPEPPPLSHETPTLDAVEAHVERHIGPVDTVFHEIVSPHVHIDVLQVAPTSERPLRTLVTCGCSARPMAVPDDPQLAEVPRRIELVAHLPPDWPVTDDAFEDERHYWPVRLLKTLARLPHEYGTWLGYGHSMPNGDPPEPYAPGTALCGAILLPPINTPEAFWRLEDPQHGEIAFFGVVALHADELALKLDRGTDALIDAWDGADADVSEIVDPDRPSALRKPRGLFRRRR